MSWVLWFLVAGAAILVLWSQGTRYVRRNRQGCIRNPAKPLEQWSESELLSWLGRQHKEADLEFEDTCYIEVTDAMQLWPADSNRRSICREIVEAILQFGYLKDGGLEAQQAWERVLGFYGLGKPVDGEDPTTMVGTILESLRPGYRAQYGDVLKGALPLVQSWVLNKIREAKIGPSHPPAEWIRFRLEMKNVDREPLPIVRDSIDREPFKWADVRLKGWSKWERLKGRMVEGDELWAYSSAAEPQDVLCGRAGVAVLRRGRPVGQVVLVMN